jgi:hypothetical protein
LLHRGFPTREEQIDHTHFHEHNLEGDLERDSTGVLGLRSRAGMHVRRGWIDTCEEQKKGNEESRERERGSTQKKKKKRRRKTKGEKIHSLGIKRSNEENALSRYTEL